MGVFSTFRSTTKCNDQLLKSVSRLGLAPKYAIDEIDGKDKLVPMGLKIIQLIHIELNNKA